jgi:hypothetical protein
VRKMAQFGFVAMTALCFWSSGAGAYPLHKGDSEGALRDIEPYLSGFEARARRLSAQTPAQPSPRVSAAVIPEPLVGTVRTALFGVAALSTLLFLVGLFGELKGARIDGANQSTLVAGFRRYEVHTVTGFVRSPTKALETQTMVSGNQYNVGSSSRTYVPDQFFIAHQNGETPFQLVDFNLPLRDGHRFSAVWAIRKGRERGPYIMFRNHTTNQRIVVDKVLRGMLRPRIWPLLALLVAVWAIGLQSLLALMNFSQSEIGLAIPIAIGVTIWGILGWSIALLIVSSRRVRRFKQRELSQISDALEASAQDLIERMEGWASPA